MRQLLEVSSRIHNAHTTEHTQHGEQQRQAKLDTDNGRAMMKSYLFDGRLFGVGSGAAASQQQKQKFRQTQQFEAEADERHRNDVVCEERHVAGDEDTTEAVTAAHRQARRLLSRTKRRLLAPNVLKYVES